MRRSLRSLSAAAVAFGGCLGVAALVLALASCGGDGPSGPKIPAAVVVTPDAATLTVTGATARFSAQPVDKKGRPIKGATVTWSIAPTTVATIDETGTATAVSNGMAQVRAVSEGVVGMASLTVALVPASVEIVAGDGQTGVIGRPLSTYLQVRVLDAAAHPIQGAGVAFSVLEGGGSVFPVYSTTNAEGIAGASWTLGATPGVPQRLRATAGEMEVEFHATAVWPPLEVKDGLDNARETLPYEGMLEASGGTGQGYEWSLVAGALPPGLELTSAGQISGTPSQAGAYAFSVEVKDSEGATGIGEVALTVCPAPAPLAPGEARFADPPGTGECGFFLPSGAEGDRYRLAVVRSETGRDSMDVVMATVSVRGLGVAPEPAAPRPTPPLALWPGFTSPALLEAERIAAATEALHMEIREAERDWLASLPPDAKPLPSRPPSWVSDPSLPARSAPQKMLLRFPNYQGCSEVTPQPAVLLGENEYVAVYQDSAQHVSEPVGPEAAQLMLDYYRNYGKEVIDRYFGGVSDVNGDGRVVVYIVPGIRSGVAAFVRSSDLVSRELCANSNEMEIAYFKAGFVNGYQSGSYQLVGTLVHEIKHISSLYQRLAAHRFHPSWVEEGTAEIATDRASRYAWSQTGGPGMGDMVTRADLEASGATVENYNTLLRLARGLRYMASQPNAVTVNPAGAQYWTPGGVRHSHTIYGSGWHFHRWLGDAYGGAATPFADTLVFRMQNDSLAPAGPDGYPTVVGRTFAELMEEYALAVMVNGTPAPLPDRPFTSFDFPSAMQSYLVYGPSSQPAGQYPWPVTWSEESGASASFESATYEGPIGESGLRVHEFRSNGTGIGAEINVEVGAPARVVLVRIR